LEQLVARIRARGTGATLPIPSPAALAAAAAHLRDEEPLSGKELEEREREWRAVEDELHAIDEADARREGLL
jgi:hypothetical protein